MSLARMASEQTVEQQGTFQKEPGHHGRETDAQGAK